MLSAEEDSELTVPLFKEEYVIGVDISMPIFAGSNLDYRFDVGIGMVSNNIHFIYTQRGFYFWFIKFLIILLLKILLYNKTNVNRC